MIFVTYILNRGIAQNYSADGHRLKETDEHRYFKTISVLQPEADPPLAEILYLFISRSSVLNGTFAQTLNRVPMSYEPRAMS